MGERRPGGVPLVFGVVFVVLGLGALAHEAGSGLDALAVVAAALVAGGAVGLAVIVWGLVRAR